MPNPQFSQDVNAQIYNPGNLEFAPDWDSEENNQFKLTKEKITAILAVIKQKEAPDVGFNGQDMTVIKGSHQLERVGNSIHTAQIVVESVITNASDGQELRADYQVCIECHMDGVMLATKYDKIVADQPIVSCEFKPCIMLNEQVI